jgi:hypothetical protein
MHAPNRTLLAALLASTLAACSSDSFMPTTPAGPTEVSESSLNVITVAPTELPETTSVSFYAVKGNKREQRLYSERADGSRGDEYLRLTVDDNSLLAAPDGRPFLQGDSVLITILVADRSHMLFQLEPAGLTFNPANPAELRVSYAVAGGDLDHDGDHDAADDSLQTHLGIWRQELPGTPFQRLPSLVSVSSKDVQADLPGFSRYAVSY